MRIEERKEVRKGIRKEERMYDKERGEKTQKGLRLVFDVLSRFEVMSLPLYWNKPHQLFLTLTATSLF